MGLHLDDEGCIAKQLAFTDLLNFFLLLLQVYLQTSLSGFFLTHLQYK